MPAFVEIASLHQMASGSATVVTIADNAIMLFNVDGDIYATEAWCLCCGSCLGGGTLSGELVRCGRCQWQYDVTTGSVVTLPALRLDTFAVKVVANRIMLASIWGRRGRDAPAG